MNYIEIFGSYGAVNTACLSYKNQSVSAIQKKKKTVAVCSGSHVEHVNTSCGEGVKFLNVKTGGI